MSGDQDVLSLSAARTAIQEWFQREGSAWIFVAKTVLAALLALWIGLRFGIDNARSALLTVLIVAQPQSGPVVAKSFYRVIGTLAGLVVTVVLLSLFAQTRELFIAAVAIWIGLCAAGAAYYRGFRTYGFLLAGYTTCLIGFPAAQHPEIMYDIALSRVSAVLIGIICAGVVADVILPERMTDSLVKIVRGRFKDFVVFSRQTLRGELDQTELQQAHHRFIADVLLLDTQRSAAYFESPDARVRDERLRLFNAEFMAASTSMHALHQWMERMRKEQREEVLAAISPLNDELSEALLHNGNPPATGTEAKVVAGHLAQLLPRLERHAARATAVVSEDNRIDCECAADLLLRYALALHDYAEAYGSLSSSGRRAPHTAPAFVPHTDPLVAAIYGVRAVFALLIITAFWIESAWPNGGNAAVIVAVGCTLFSQSPAPERAVRQLGIGFLLGFIAMLIWTLAVLPRIDGFEMLALTLVPLLMMSNRLVVHPKYAGIGLGMNLLFINEATLDNAIVGNPLAAINDGPAQIIGIALVGIAFSIFLPADAALLRRRKIRRLYRQVAFACTAPLKGLRHRLENRTRDLLIQILPNAQGDTSHEQRVLNDALMILEVGDAVIALREALRREDVDPLTRRILRASGVALAKAYELPSSATQADARNEIERAMERMKLLLNAGYFSLQIADAHQKMYRCLYRLGRALNDERSAIDGDRQSHHALDRGAYAT